MISFIEFKKMLGNYGQKLTEDQLRFLYDAEIKMADIFIDQWIEKRNQNTIEGNQSARNN